MYVDKTDLVWKIANGFQYVFLSRPRRFGKSLLTSTLKSYFEGRKDLFEGLAIEQMEKDWTEYPVLQFDMSGGKHMDVTSLNSYLDYILGEQERKFGIVPKDNSANNRVSALITHAYEQTGKPVVVLIDEYDAPLLDTMVDDDQFDQMRKMMKNFYSPLKKCDPYLRFVFLTGITKLASPNFLPLGKDKQASLCSRSTEKFSQLSIFSELNNIKNVSMEDEYAAICGITKEEMLTQLSEDIDLLAEKYKVGREEMVKMLTAKYDGYHFSAESPDIFNPFSLLNCFDSRKLNNYWFGSGTPTFLIDMMRKFGTRPTDVGTKIQASANSFDVPTENLRSITPLLYQSGYITIKDYIEEIDLYTLAIPNEEVRTGLMQSLLPNYIDIQEADTIIGQMAYAMMQNDVDGAFQLLQTFFKTVPYCRDIDHEGHWQQMLYVVFSLFGAKGDVEVHTADGRIDLALAFRGKLYLIETKLDKTAREAIDQIDIKEYDSRFALMNLPIVKIGVNFSTTERTITEYIIQE